MLGMGEQELRVLSHRLSHQVIIWQAAIAAGVVDSFVHIQCFDFLEQVLVLPPSFGDESAAGVLLYEEQALGFLAHSDQADLLGSDAIGVEGHLSVVVVLLTAVDETFQAAGGGSFEVGDQGAGCCVFHQHIRVCICILRR